MYTLDIKSKGIINTFGLYNLIVSLIKLNTKII